MSTTRQRRRMAEIQADPLYVPRRRKTVVCAYLRMNGRPVPPEDWPALWASLPKLGDNFSDRYVREGGPDYRCAATNVGLYSARVVDQCSTSWCHSCPNREPAMPRGEIVSLSFQRRSA